MGTKRNPEEFDCHGKAEPDEPTFTLLARDPLAPILVEQWAALRESVKPMSLTPDPAREARKRREALVCAETMRRWAQQNKR